MPELKEKSMYAKDNLDNEPYVAQIGELQDSLHELRKELAEAEKSALQDEGYKPINIDSATIMVPVGMTFRQLQVSMQQMPPPDEDRDRVVKYLVDDEDKRIIRESAEYQDVVKKRRGVIKDIMSVYQEFWRKEVNPNSQTEEDTIIYMMAGLNKNIRSRKLSEITGVSEEKCKMYYLEDGVVQKKE